MDLITPEQLSALADAMHAHGVRKLKCGNVEIEAGEAPRKPHFELDKAEDQEKVDKARIERLNYGSSF